MPGYDRTGPRGEGPMTGGGFGYCGTGRPARYGVWPLVGMGLGLGLRWGARRFGRGFGRGYGPRYGAGYGAGYVDPAVWAAPTATEEAAGLEEEASFLRRQLEAMEARIAALREDKGETGQGE